MGKQTSQTKDLPTLNSEVLSPPSKETNSFFPSERILSSILLWDAKTSRSGTRAREKTIIRRIDGPNGPRDIRLKVYASGNEGMPNTVDLEFHLAFERLVTERLEQEGRVENPVRVTGGEILKRAGKAPAGSAYEELRKYFRVMTLTGLSLDRPGSSNKSKERVFHVFDEVVQENELRLDGSTASAHEIHLAEWYRRSLEAGNCLIMDSLLFQQLTRPLSKILHQLLHSLFALGQGRAEQRYSELAINAQVSKFTAISRIKQQLDPSHEELKRLGFLDSWDYTRQKGKDFLLRYVAGPQWWNCFRVLRQGQLEGEQARAYDPFITQGESSQLPLPPEDPAIQLVMVEEILKFVGPKDTRYRPFWSQAVRNLPRTTIYKAMGEVQEKLVNGKVRNRASYLLTLLKVEGKKRGLAWAVKG